MIYLVKNNGDQTFITDTISTYFPSLVDLYIDDINIGNYDNISTSSLYIKVVVPESVLDQLEEKEYILKIKSYGALLKEELCQVRDFHPLTIKSYKD